jgi:hypothetical protein
MIPVLQASESQKSSHLYQTDDLVDEEDDEGDGINSNLNDPSFGLQANPDFMNLLNMMNSMAT